MQDHSSDRTKPRPGNLDFERTSFAVEAGEENRVEEAKFTVAERIRADSANMILTPSKEVDSLLEWAKEAERTSILAALESDERFNDLQKMIGSQGEVYYHSINYLSGRNGLFMMRARTAEPAVCIAEYVREQSRIQPLCTKLTQFEAPVFGIEKAKLESVVREMLKRPEYVDIRMLVHAGTNAAYLYSNKWLSEEQALEIMDWEETGKTQYR